MLSALPPTSETSSPSTSSILLFLEDDSSSDESIELDETSRTIVKSNDINKDNTNNSADTQTDTPKSIKDVLRKKIRARRKSSGAGDLEVSFETPKNHPLTQEESRKRETRRQRNRDSANRSRLKRKFKLEYLEKEESELNKEKAKLSADVSALKKVKETMTEQLSTHTCNMPKVAASGSADTGQSSNLQKETEVYKRGRSAFEELPLHIQEAFVKIFEKSDSITLQEALVKVLTKQTNDQSQPGSSTNG